VIAEIEKILGSNIEKLSFIDAWLLLESSYWHDVGMIVTFEEKEKIINSSDFKKYLSQLSTEKSDLSIYANICVEQINGNSKTNFIELEKSFLFVLAEYVRREHPERSKEILLNPDAIGIESPATGLINSRLFLLLSDIIECHGKSFDSILNIPFENDGLDVFDTAHPRFIACLLRVGDLLDLEDGRHCPTLLRTIGSLPPLSLAHLEKHRSIISKNVNERSIEIISKCESFDAFEAQNEWFSFIRTEFSEQDKNWANIAPLDVLWKLPNIKELVCELDGNIPVGNSSNRLLFDKNRIYNYISGINLYDNPLSCIDELLQNAVDAIIERIWLEHKDRIKTIGDLNSIINEDDCRIDVNISDSESVSDTEMKYKIEIIDNGKGMSIDDIQALTTIASEKSQIAKEKHRHEMPEWMRPSGYFGIGLQSVFVITDQLTINTNSPNDLSYEITIRKTPGNTPSIVVKKSKSISWDFGTSITFFLEVQKIPLVVSGSRSSSKKLYQFDPLADNTLDSKKAEIIDKIGNFAMFNRINIYCNNQLCMSKYSNNNFSPMIIDTENGLEYSLEFYSSYGKDEWYYRGRKTGGYVYLNHVGIEGNILSGSANEYLTIDRQKFHQKGLEKIKEIIERSLINNKEKILKQIKNKNEASLYYFLYDEIDNDNWKNIELSGYKLGELITPGNKYFIAPQLREKKDGIINKDKKIITDDEWDVSTLINVLIKLGRGINIINISDEKYISSINTCEYETTVFEVEIMNNNESSVISDEAIQYLSSQGLWNKRTRYWLPCGKNQYQEIALDIGCFSKYPWITTILPGFINLFPMGIIIRSTHKILEDDIKTLVSTIKREKEAVGISISEDSIKKVLKSFYEKFPFESKNDPETKMLMED
jgi:hypothetical protein